MKDQSLTSRIIAWCQGSFWVRTTLILAALVAVGAMISRLDFSPDLEHLEATMATGPERGNYEFIGKILARKATRQGGHLTLAPTAGSVENLNLLMTSAKEGECQFDFGLSQAGLNIPEDSGLELIVRLQQAESVFFLGRSGDQFVHFKDLRGKRIGIGPKGSGTAIVARQILEGRDFQDLDIRLENLTFDEQLAGLQKGQLDLAVFVLGEDAELIDQAIRDQNLQMASFNQLDVIAGRHDFLSIGTIEAGQYNPVQILPPKDKKVLRIETLVLGNGCAGHAETIALLTLLTDTYPGLLHFNANTPNGSGLPYSDDSKSYYTEGGASWADRYIPWLVNIMPPSNWVYVVMAVSLLFNAMGFFHRFSLWRIDVNRVKIEQRISELMGSGWTNEDLSEYSCEAVEQQEKIRQEFSQLIDEVEEMKESCRRKTVSFVVPMGQEMGYRYQEENMTSLLAALRRLGESLNNKR